MHNYHDVTVYAGNTVYKPSNNHALMLMYTKSDGWELWQDPFGKGETLLGSEYDDEPFCIEVDGHVICGAKPETI